MKRIAAILVAGAIALTITGATPALANEGHHRHHKARLNFTGVVTGVSSTSLSFTMLSGNHGAQDWASAHPGAIIAGLNADTSFGPRDVVDQPSDLRVGDGVKVLAVRTSDGTALTALRVRLKLQRYEGTVVTFSAGSSITVHWDTANKLAQAWLAAHGNPQPVSATITAATRIESGGTNPKAGDHVELTARVSAGNAGVLEAVKIETGEDDD